MSTNISMALRQTSAGGHIAKWLRYLGLAMAGCASFMVAVYFSSARNDDNALEPRTNLQEFPSKANAGDAGVNSIISSNVSYDSSGITSSNNDQSNNINVEERQPRLSADVSQSPFDVLNLTANINTPALPAQTSQTTQLPAQAHYKPVKKRGNPTLPPAPEIVQEPPPPVAPALPFIAIGSIQGPRIGDGKQIAFLNHQGVILVVKSADIIGGDYRVESITDKVIEFTYLPLKQKHSLRVPN